MTDTVRLNANSTNGAYIATKSVHNVNYQKVILSGQTDGGSVVDVPATAEGHLEVALHHPRNPFGSIHAEHLDPVFNIDAVYGINVTEELVTTGVSAGTATSSGVVSGDNNLFTCSTGTTQYSFATLQSRKRLRYRAGQGLVGRFAGFFSTPAASSIVVAGFGTAESGLYFGYNGTSFGILHSTGGIRELQTMTITTASTATNNYVVTMPNGVAVNVTATNNNNTARTAYEISRGTFPGWEATARGNTVLFLASSAGPVTGTFSLAQTGAVTPAAGTTAETTAGVAATDTWYPQTTWNGDPLDGTGPSGYTADWQKGQVFQVQLQYLGFGTVSFQVETTSTGRNNAEFVTVHTIKFPGQRTTTTFRNPSFPFTMAAYSAGSTTDVSVSVGSFGGFIEGYRRLTGPRVSYTNTATSSTSAYVPLFTFRNERVYGGKANQGVLNILSVGGACRSANNGITSFHIIRNATLTGPTSFGAYATGSCTYIDTTSTGCSFADNNQLIWVGTVSETGQIQQGFTDEITVQPGETITLAVRSVTATAVCVGQINTREDQ